MDAGSRAAERPPSMEPGSRPVASPRRYAGLVLSALMVLTLSAPASAHGDDRVRVVTWNTWGLPEPFAPGRARRLPRIHQALPDLGADVVALQELWRGARRLISGPRVWVPDTRGDSGLAIYTPHPTSPPRALSFTHASGLDALKRKGAMHTRVETPSGALDVVAVHLQAGRTRRAAATRALQIEELLAWTADLRGPTVLLGDVNLTGACPGDRASEAALQAGGFTDVARSLGSTAPTWGGGHRLDRVFVRGGVEPVATGTVEGFTQLSDHLPLAAELRLY